MSATRRIAAAALTRPDLIAHARAEGEREVSEA